MKKITPRAGPSRGVGPSKPGPGVSSISPGPGRLSSKQRSADAKLKAERKKPVRAHERLAKLEHARMVERVCRQEQLPESVAMLVSSQLHEASRLASRRCVTLPCGRLSLMRSASARVPVLRESLGIGVEGAGPRQAMMPWTNGNGAGIDLLGLMGVHRG